MKTVKGMKKSLKQALCALTALVFALSFAGCASTPAPAAAPQATAAATDAPQATEAAQPVAEKIKIAIVQPMEHTSLNEIRDTIVSELQSAGYDDSKAEIILKNANGDASLLPSIFNSLVADDVDLLIPIATPSAQAAAAATTDIPIVFSAVSNPIDAGLVTSLDVTDKNITGVSNAIAIEDIFGLAKELTPEAKTFGFIYNTGEINSVAGITRAKAYCDANGITYKEATITTTADLQQAVASIVGDVDAFFTPNDNTVASAMQTYVQLATEAGKPIYCGADSMVRDGGFATVGIDYVKLGKQTAEMAIRVLNGAAISDTPVEVVNEYARMINVKNAADLNIALSDEVKGTFKLFGEQEQ